ncbi:MAG: serine/threonine protein kinase [Pseudomonadota bacterium]|nr:serine/threonine protein kinase [Pseudomonadota bacterium]
MDYATLDPQQVLDALDAVGLRGDGRVLQLNSYENRVFQVFLEDGSAVVAKFYRPGRWSNAQIVEEHGFALELAAAEVPVVPPLALSAAAGAPGLTLQGEPPTLACLTLGATAHRYAIAQRCAGREPELEDPATLQQLGRFIGRLHAVGRQRPFVQRHRMDARADGRRALKLLLDGGFVPPTEAAAWQSACERALDAVESAFSAAAPLATLRLHGDCHLGNVLWRDNKPHVVDLDDAMQGPAVQDLWMLVSGDHATMARQLNDLLAGYEQFCEFDDRERRLIEPLRTLRMLRHSAWLAERWSDPSFPLNFPFFGSAAYWSQQTAQLREQLELMR